MFKLTLGTSLPLTSELVNHEPFAREITLRESCNACMFQNLLDKLCVEIKRELRQCESRPMQPPDGATWSSV